MYYVSAYHVYRVSLYVLFELCLAWSRTFRTGIYFYASRIENLLASTFWPVLSVCLSGCFICHKNLNIDQNYWTMTCMRAKCLIEKKQIKLFHMPPWPVILWNWLWALYKKAVLYSFAAGGIGVSQVYLVEKYNKIFKPRPWGIKCENVSFLPSLSPAVKSFTPFKGVYIAR